MQSKIARPSLAFVLACLLGACAAAEGGKLAARHQALELQVTPPDLTIASDAKAVVDMIKRLLGNAVKFTPDGGQIGITAHLSPESTGDSVEITVWDTDDGIAPDQLQRIQQPFTQLDGSLARNYDGIGMGLAIVDQTVRLLGGRLAVASTPEEGSRFTVTLPARLRE